MNAEMQKLHPTIRKFLQPLDVIEADDKTMKIVGALYKKLGSQDCNRQNK